MKNKKIFLLALIIAIIVITCGGCGQKINCPTYASANRAQKQLSFEKRGGHTGACVYVEIVTIKDKKRSNKIWQSDFCYVKPKKRK